MRLIRLTTHYPAYIKQFYDQRLDLKNKSYIIQYQELMADCYMWADFWTHALGKLGYEVWENVANAEPMQKAWARENGVSYNQKTWLTDIQLAQVKHFQPDIIFIFDYNSFSAEFLRFLRRECPNIKLVIGWCGAPPYGKMDVFKEFDLVLSNIPILVEQFRNSGHHSEYMCHAFEPRILDKIDKIPQQKIDFSFIGSVVKRKGLHNQREKLLNTLVAHTNLQIWANISQPSKVQKVLLPLKQELYDFIQSTKHISGLNSLYQSIPKIKAYCHESNRPSLSHYVDPSIAYRSHPSIFGVSMYQKLYESNVTLNNHIDISAKFASNMRMYEATGIGTCLLTDWQDNLHEIFEPDVEVVTYRNAEEAVEKINYLLEHEDERQKIALAGQRRTLQSHTFEIRAQQLSEFIQSSLRLESI
ncbi:glycosyltransferase family 1 protein [Calothrix membranacea FACHB-236]|nr:glycosyltransferase family 1 protein [Calothrix membranacea FACHB-236]